MDEEDSSGDESVSVIDSDVELQEAFARGDLKPGLVRLESKSKPTKKPPLLINNIPKLQALLQQIKLPSSYEWIERLDVSSELAPLAPEIAFQLDEHREKREKDIHVTNARKKQKKSPSTPILSIQDDPIHNDFKRELSFHRQAQSAILSCIPQIKSLGIPTQRPDDYFAEMAKSDSHMQKVASVLLKKQTAAEKAEKVRKIRDQKKFAKQTQVQVLQERQKAKKELIEGVKKYRKGQKNSLDFLEHKSAGKRADGKGGNRKRELKNERYGYGGKKRGFKRNTKESLDNEPPPRGANQTGRGQGGRSQGQRGRSQGQTGRVASQGGSNRRAQFGRRPSTSAKGGKPKRPGKSNRMKKKAHAS